MSSRYSFSESPVSASSSDTNANSNVLQQQAQQAQQSQAQQTASKTIYSESLLSDYKTMPEPENTGKKTEIYQF